MMRLAPFALIGFVLMAIGIGVSNMLVSFLGIAVLIGGLAWFLLSGTGTHLDDELRSR